MPTVITRGAASAQGYGYAGVKKAANYIEDVFSTYLYKGTGATQTITNGIDLSTKGGLVWLKGRSGATDHALYDTARGATFDIASNLTTAQTTQATGLTAFGATDFTIGSLAKINTSSATYASWTFRKQAKFFDVVTYTGNGTGQNVSHSLGSVPGCIIVKRIAANSNWAVYHRGLTSAAYSIGINSTAAQVSNPTCWNSTTPTSSVFTVGANADVNTNGVSYVAYLFAHDAGGFGASGTDNVISCGSYVGNGTTIGSLVSLGYEPQWLLIKNATSATDWRIVDNMRGIPMSDLDMVLAPNTSVAETDSITCNLAATGFNPTGPHYNSSSSTYIYIAIRRGPMKTPTTGTSVFALAYYTNIDGGPLVGFDASSVNLRPDLSVLAKTAGSANNFQFADMLRGYQQTIGPGVDTLTTPTLKTSSVNSEATSGNAIYINPSNGIYGPTVSFATSGVKVNYIFRRAPGFFDVVCYTGTGANRTVSHNLGVVPELMIVKGRSGATAWQVYSKSLANTEYLVLNTTAAKATGATRWNSTTPTASVFSLGTASEVNTSAATYVAYLFATVAGVNKVGSYTGSGTTQQIDCGFTGGARFVLIKRTDSTGDWYVWDTARGIVAGNDPYLLLNSTAAEVTSTDYIDTYSAGFEISSTAPAAINANGGSFIFLAIA